MPKETWSPADIKFLNEKWELLTPKQIADHLGKTENAVNLYIHRKRLTHQDTAKKNLLKEMLSMRFIRPELFHPDRRFLNDVGMTQVRFWRVYRGETPLSPKEYIKIASVLEISLEKAFEARQLKLFDDNKEE